MLLICILYTPSVFLLLLRLTNDKIHFLIKLLIPITVTYERSTVLNAARYMNVLKQLFHSKKGYFWIQFNYKCCGQARI